MNDIVCSREPATLEAARTGAWSGPLREHSRSCPDCAAALAVHGALLERAAHLRAMVQLPAPEGLLWRARFQQRIDRAERLGRPIAIFDRLAVGAAVAAAVGGLAWKSSAVGAWLGNALGARVGPSPEVIALLLVGLAFTGAVIWVFTTWAEE